MSSDRAVSETSVELNRTVAEAASWHLASELHRRHPDRLTLFRGFFAEGMYDMLCLRSTGGASVDLNRNGSVHLHAREHGDANVNSSPMSWAEYLAAADPREMIDKILNELRLGSPTTIPVSTPAVLVHRLLARLAALHIQGKPVQAELGVTISYGWESESTDWFKEFRATAGQLASPMPGDLHGESGCRFWRFATVELELVLETSTGTAWGPTRQPLLLPDTYAANSRRMSALTATALRHGLR